jgi:hypothetical protein
LVILSLVERTGRNQKGVEKLAGMYQGLARQHRMNFEVLGERHDQKHDRAYLLISGLGAFALLNNESGLHQMDYRFRERTPRAGRELMREDRELLRVESLPCGNEPDAPFRRAVKSKVSLLKPARSRLLDKATLNISVFHEPSLRSLELWMAGSKEHALERALVILHAQVSRPNSDEQNDAAKIIRHYDLGLAPRVKDLRSGRTTTQVDRVLKGRLEALRPAAQAEI